MKAMPYIYAPQAVIGGLQEQLPLLKAPDAVLRGALAIANLRGPVDSQAVLDNLERMSDAIRGKVKGHQPQALLAHLTDYLYNELGFRGVADNRESAVYLPSVLDGKVGFSSVLAVVYHTVAHSLGFDVHGVGVPGAFYISIAADGEAPMLIDPMTGGIRNEGEIRAKVLATVQGAENMPIDFAPVSARHWLTRIMQTMLNIFGGKNDMPAVAAVLEMEMVLWPEQIYLKRDLGLVAARSGNGSRAADLLDEYLGQVTDDPQEEQLRELLGVLRQ
jgi:regulator of sirC expression with transglutaminase-like and TPR domain